MLLGLRKLHSVKRVVASPSLARVGISRDFVSDVFPKTHSEFDSWRQEFQHLRIDKQSADPLASWEAKIGQHIKVPRLPVHPLGSFPQDFELFLTRPRFELLRRFFREDTSFLCLTGPRGVGKSSSIAYTTACIAFVNQMPLFYLPSPEILQYCDATEIFLEDFAALNRFVENERIQSVIAMIPERLCPIKKSTLLAKLARDSLAQSGALRVVDEIQLAYEIRDFPKYSLPIVDWKNKSDGYGKLLAISSVCHKYECDIDPTSKVTLLAPSKEDFMAMLMPMARDHLLRKGLGSNPTVEVAEGEKTLSVEDMLSAAIDELGSPREVTGFFETFSHETSTGGDGDLVSSFFKSLRNYSIDLSIQMHKAIQRLFKEQEQNQGEVELTKTIKQLAINTHTPMSLIGHKLHDWGLAYKDGDTLRLLGRVAKKAFFAFLEYKDLMMPVVHSQATDSERRAVMRKHLLDEITFYGFFTTADWNCEDQRRLDIQLPVELSSGFGDRENFSAINRLTSLVIFPSSPSSEKEEESRSCCGVDFLVTDPDRKDVYAVQVSTDPFFAHQRAKFESRRSLDKILTGKCSEGEDFAKKTICKLVGLAEDQISTTEFKLNKTAIEIMNGKKGEKGEKVSPWRIVPVFVTDTPVAANQREKKKLGEVIDKNEKELRKFFKSVRVFADKDINGYYKWKSPVDQEQDQAEATPLPPPRRRI